MQANNTQSILIATLFSAVGIGFTCDLLHENEYKRVASITRRREARSRVYTVTFADGTSYETFGEDRVTVKGIAGE